MKKRPIRYLIFGMIGIALIISLKTINDYSEKNLDDVIRYKSNVFTSMTIRDLSVDVEWKTDNNDATEEIMKFLNKYRIKKISNRAFDYGGLGNDERFEIIINHSKGDNLFALIEEDKVHIYNKGYYQVVNGPIDMSWIRNFSATE